MSRLKRLIHEIHRRSLWQVLGIYVVGAWIALQVADTVTAALGLPDWVPQVALVLLIVLLPVVLATAFVQEGVGGGAARPEGAAAPEAESAEAEPTREDPEADVRGVHHRVFTWRNAIVVGVVAFALLGVAVSGYMAMRLLGIGPPGTLMAKGVLEERDRIVLADFENHTPDSLVAHGATEWFRTALSQSTVVTLAGGDYLASVLQRMGKDPSVPLDSELAREVAIRQGLKVVIAGEVTMVGASYVLSARLVAAETGEPLWADSETAQDSAEIIEAVDRLSRHLREQVGESLKTIRANEPLPQVTTTSLEALQQFSLGMEAVRFRNDSRGAVPYLEAAIALDSGFASAYNGLANVFANLGQWARAREMARRAYELRERATLSERYRIEGDYHWVVTEDIDATIRAYEMSLETGDSIGANNLAILYYAYRRDYERAERLRSRGLERTDSMPLLLGNMAVVKVALGKFDEASLLLEQANEEAGEDRFAWSIVWLEAARGYYDEAEARLRAIAERHGRDLERRAWTSEQLASVARLRGRLAEAERHLDDAISAREEQGQTASSIANSMWQGLMVRWFGGDTAAALRRVEAALDRWPLDSIPVPDRTFNQLVEFYAWGGQNEQARAYLAEYEEQADFKGRDYRTWRHYLLGTIAVNDGRPHDAITEYRSADRLEGCPMCALPSLAYAYDQAGEPDSALAVYERYVTTPWIARIWDDSWWLARAYERLGYLYEQRGDTTKAIRYYAKLAELWNDADPELQPRVEAARRAIEALSPDT
jgi:tetratricopeptide (TPR) repeat protein